MRQMSDDERQRRLAAIEKEQAALNQRREQQRRQKRATSDTEAAVLGTRGKGTGRVWTIAVLVLLLAPASWLGAMTIGRHTGNDYADARSILTVQVQACKKHGPVTLKGGFGTWYSCRLKLNQLDTRTISDPGFFATDETGKTITIGDNGTSRGNHHWSRPELPSRPLLNILVVALGIIAALIGVVLLIAVWGAIRGGKGRMVR